MNMPECAKCDDSRRDLCRQLYEGFVAIDTEAVEELEEKGLIDSLPAETLDMMSRAANDTALRALGFLTQWDCELTLEQVEQRLILTKNTKP